MGVGCRNSRRLRFQKLDLCQHCVIGSNDPRKEDPSLLKKKYIDSLLDLDLLDYILKLLL